MSIFAAISLWLSGMIAGGFEADHFRASLAGPTFSISLQPKVLSHVHLLHRFIARLDAIQVVTASGMNDSMVSLHMARH